MPKAQTVDNIIKVLKEVQGDTPQRKFAWEMGISESYLCKVYKGVQAPGPRILDYLGIKKQRKITVETTYEWTLLR